MGMLPLASGVINSCLNNFLMLLLISPPKVVSWTPMDAVSKCIVELIFHNKRLPPVLNVVHPRPTDWNTVIKLIGDALVLQKKLYSPLTLISFQEWFYVLKARAKAANQENKIELRIVRLNFFSFGSFKKYDLAQPGVKLLDFFREMSEGDLKVATEGQLDTEAGGLTNFSTSKIQSISKAMRDLESLVPEDIERWVKYWDAAGLFINRI
jgi:hypothetical protein